MKRKLILPLLAIVFAIAGAFASSPAVQMAWFHSGPNQATLSTIDNTDQPCETGLTTICRIQGEVAYSTEAAAKVESANSILKYE